MSKWTVRCKCPGELYPVMIHTGKTHLIETLTVRTDKVKGPIDSVAIPQILVRLPGLVETPWLLPLPRAKHKSPQILSWRTPPNPPVTMPPERMRQDIPYRSYMEILVDGEASWRGELTLLPPTSMPPRPDVADVMASFIMPVSEEVSELVRRARERFLPNQGRSGFPQISSEQAANILYFHLARSREPAYAWEPAPRSIAQRIRLPSEILKDGQATCIDLALLFCSLVEHIRRLPVLLGVCVDEALWHIIPGMRLDDDDIDELVLTRNLKHVKAACDKKRTRLFDPDALVRGLDPDEADAMARARMAKARKAFLLDVQSARNANIWPLVIAAAPRSRPHLPRVGIVQHRDNTLGLPEDLARDVAAGQAVFLLGDVLDSQSALPRAEFSKGLSERAGLQENDLLRAGNRLEKEIGRQGLVHLALKLLDVGRQRNTRLYEVLGALPINTVVSFHPDPILERVLVSHDLPFHPLVDDDDLARLHLSSSTRELYQLGGSALSGKGLVLTFGDHQQLLRRIELLARGLRQRLASGTIVLLSCDTSDRNLQILYSMAVDHLSRQITPVYLCASGQPLNWLGHARVIDQSPSTFLEALARTGAQKLTTATPAAARKTLQRSPYKFLDYFEFEDRELFFGREEDTVRVAAEIKASPSRLTVLCGRSGVGKTSLVKAALAHRLEQDPRIFAVYARCGPNPEESIRNALLAHIDNTARGVNVALDVVCESVFRQDGRERVVFIDQMEEAFIKLGPPLLKKLFCSIDACVNNPKATARFVFVIREDFLAQLANHADQLWGVLSSVYRLQELTRSAAREAILRPAFKCGLRMESALAETILDDLSPDRVLPAHLQIICDRLYRECSIKGELTRQAYLDLGRAERILNHYLEEALRQMPEKSERSAKAILRALVTSENTKDLLTIGQIATRCRLTEEQVQDVLSDFVHEQRLVREVLGDMTRFELAHESLAITIGTWLDAKEAKTKYVQEILEQEILSSRQGLEYRIPRDKLLLINKYRRDIHIEADELEPILNELMLQGLMEADWYERLSAFPVELQYKILFWRPATKYPEALSEILRTNLSALLETLPVTTIPPFMVTKLRDLIARGNEDALPNAMALALKDEGHSVETAVINQFPTLTGPRTELVLRYWIGAVRPHFAALPVTNSVWLNLIYILGRVIPDDDIVNLLKDLPLDRPALLLGHDITARSLSSLSLTDTRDIAEAATAVVDKCSGLEGIAAMSFHTQVHPESVYFGRLAEEVSKVLGQSQQFDHLTPIERTVLVSAWQDLEAHNIASSKVGMKYAGQILEVISGNRARTLEDNQVFNLVFSSKAQNLARVNHRFRMILTRFVSTHPSVLKPLLKSEDWHVVVHVLDCWASAQEGVTADVRSEVQGILEEAEIGVWFAAMRVLTRWDAVAAIRAIRDLLHTFVTLLPVHRSMCIQFLCDIPPLILCDQGVLFLGSRRLRGVFLDAMLAQSNPLWLLENPGFLHNLLKACAKHYPRKIQRLIDYLLPNIVDNADALQCLGLAGLGPIIRRVERAAQRRAVAQADV